MRFYTIATTCRNGDHTIRGEIELSAGYSVSIEETIVASTSPAVALAIDISKMKMFYAVSDVDLDLSFVGPDSNLQLAANVPLCWFVGSGLDNPISGGADVENLVVANDGDVNGTLKIEMLSDPT